ncbi:MAG: FMN-binding glutamate synthase family protein [Sandaracinaceae bacterium]|jgi:glutamate synthase domain-containing protein 2|nr:FMN-binding glutamate synthase family protein [Sandaracinaceae bacterium]MBP7684734.1 FMN-binding glutamate synthase family protein [Deltaproteobacteria bacterium]MBK6809426.1 FMN-binding glutamate synthase family protein [Sandaracinaceae bacterium]MBK7151231.1 FMN-binding glutamate synthase family protein [Sandaracinaceae bacterium]MBK7777873.1 FMN-binding glutamate synthase family protein [Sandaracinaceae bacterium]
MWALWFLVPIGLLSLVAIYDRRQRSNTIIANFPIVGRFRYWFEALGGPLRQYIVTGNDEERPFTRDQRRWVYASAKVENNYFGFGTDNELEQTSGYLIIRQSTFPITSPVKGQPGYDPKYRVPCAKILGGYRNRKHAFRPPSIVNTSAMSYGSLSGAAIESINRGVAIAGAWQNTGEGGISPYHRKGGDLLWQLGTGYYGCRDEKGNFSMERFLENVASAPVKGIEIKLSQGAKPGLGGVLPAAKITPEISAIRHVPMGKDCISPASHGAFSDVSSMLDFIERLADASGLPVGIKSAVGQMGFWHELAKQMETTGRAPDFISIDGGEGGTGAAPLVFSDHVSLPFKLGFTSVYRAMAERGMHEKVVFIGTGRLGFPQQVLFSMALGCDLVSVAREAMLAIGCIQAQECHTGHCPTGVATQKPWLVKGLDPTLKSARLANYIMTLRKETLALAHACGEAHPGVVPLDHFDIVDGFATRPAREVFGYDPRWGLPEDQEREAIREVMRSLA